MGAALAACQAGPARDPDSPQVISVVRSVAWGPGAQEDDVWEVEVPATATIADLKVKIEELYNVPRQAQRLARSAEPSAPVLEDDVRLDAALEQRRAHLLPPELPAALAGLGLPGLGLPGLGLPGPSPEQRAALSDMMGNLLGAARENMEVRAALEESLKGVSYSVHFHRPASAGGKAAGKRVTLAVDALALAGNVQEMVEVELFGDTGAEPAVLVFEGRVLPPQLSVHRAGIEDGKTVEVLRERPPMSEQEQILASLLGPAAPALGGAGLAPGLLGGLPLGAAGVPPDQLQQMLAGLLGPGTPAASAGAPPTAGQAARR